MSNTLAEISYYPKIPCFSDFSCEFQMSERKYLKKLRLKKCTLKKEQFNPPKDGYNSKGRKIIKMSAYSMKKMSICFC